MKTWLKKQITELTHLQGHPEPDEALFDLCASIVRDAADRAAKLGMLDLYERHKNERFCTPRDAVAILNTILAARQPLEFLTPPEAAQLLGVNSDKVRNWIRSGKLPAINTSRQIRPRWKIARTDVENLRQTATPKRRVTRHSDPDVIQFY